MKNKEKYITYLRLLQQSRKYVPPISLFRLGQHLQALGFGLQDMPLDEMAHGWLAAEGV